MGSLKQEIEDNSRDVLLDCGCCSENFISLSKLFAILKKRGIEVDKNV